MRDLCTLRADLAATQMQWALLKLAWKYSPDQPRVPAGNRDGGQWTSDVQIAAGSEKPPKVIAIPMYGIDPLDPKNLNTPPTPTELADIQKTLDRIDKSGPDDLAEMGKEYKNFPERTTGAILPPSADGYLSFPVGSRSVSAKRLIIDISTGAVYYTNNHYLSFYHLNLTGNAR